MSVTFYDVQTNANLIPGPSGLTCFCRLLDGTMFCVARFNSTTPDTRLFRSDDDGVSWTVDGDLNSTFGGGDRQLIVDDDERVSICNYTRNGGSGAYYLHRTGVGTFSSRYQATSTTALDHACFARDSTGKASCVTKPTAAGELRFWKQASSSEDNTGTAWTGIANELIVSSAGITNVSKPQLLIDANDIPHVLYYDSTAQKYKHVHRTGSSWSSPVDILSSPAVQAGDYFSPCLDGDRFGIHVAIWAGASSLALTPWYVRYDAGVWTGEQIDSTYGASTTLVLFALGVAVDLDENVFVYAVRDSDTAFFTRDVNAIWSRQTIDFGGTNTTGNFSTALQHYPLLGLTPNYPDFGGHFCGRFNNGTSQANRMAYLQGDGLTFGQGGLVCRGFAAKGVQATQHLVQQFMMGYDIVPIDVNGVLTFRFRSDVDEIELPDEVLGAYADGNSPENDPVRDTDPEDDRLPRDLTVKYMDVDKALQIGSQPARISSYVVDGSQVIELVITFNADEARSIAERLLWLQHANRNSSQLTLPPSYMTITEYTRIIYNGFGADDSRTGLAQKVDRGVNYLLEVEALNEVVEVLTQPGLSEDDPLFQDGQIVAPSEVLFEPIDIAPLFAGDEQTVGVYFATAALNPDITWPGGVVYISSDDSNYDQLRPIATEASMGLTLTELLEPVQTGVPDDAQTVDVEVVEGTLSSVTFGELMAGANQAVIGQEVIAFRDATLIGTNQYRLSYLLRGLRNTERFLNRHTAGERFIIIGTGVDFQSIGSSLVGAVRYYKGVPAGGNIADYQSKRLRFRGGSVLPFSVCLESATRDGSNNATITWTRRSRVVGSIFGPGGAPNYDTPESYEIDVYDPTSTTVVRTLTSSTTSVAYSAADQTTDGYTPGDPVNIAVYQISAVVGRGRTFKVIV